MEAAHFAVGLIMLAVVAGAFVQILKDPKGANALAYAGSTSYAGVVHALEGQG